MDGLSFLTATPPVVSDPARADIACFAGFVRERHARARQTGESDTSYLRQLPDWLRAWFNERSWQPGRDGRTAEQLVHLLNVPAPVDTWDIFDALFAWDQRPVGAGDQQCDTTLGVAVRSFFAQGGRKCYVVRLGDPWPVVASAEQRSLRASALLPSDPLPSAADRASWRGIGHLFGLLDVSFLCLPDLPELFAITPIPREEVSPPQSAEIFVECAECVEPPGNQILRGIPAPRCDAEAFDHWAESVGRIGDFIRGQAREVQFVATIPLPVDAMALSGQTGVAQKIRAATDAQWAQAATIQTAFVQLVYPWVRTRSSGALPGGVEPPDGLLTGLLANSVLTRGSGRSAIHQPVPGVIALEPVLDRDTLERDLSPTGTLRLPLTLRERVTIVGPNSDGFRLLSDVTTDDDEVYRPANVNRLVSAIVRAARVAGESAVFQNNGEALWARLRESLAGLLAGLWAEGALAGDSAEEAFEVRCDRSTMTQADLDAGRVITRVSFTAAAPIVHITVVLAMDEGGHVSLASRPAFSAQSQAA